MPTSSFDTQFVITDPKAVERFRRVLEEADKAEAALTPEQRKERNQRHKQKIAEMEHQQKKAIEILKKKFTIGSKADNS